MKKFLILTFIFLFNSICFAEENCFIDMEKHWAKEIVEKMSLDGSINGYEDGTFMPEKEVSYQEFLKILIVQENFKLNTTGKRWPDWYINTAIDKGLVDLNINDFSAPICRIEACKIIANYIGLDDVTAVKKSFSDLSKGNKNVVLKLVNLGIINGFQDGTFRENDAVTRAQACKIINLAYEAKNKLILEREYEITPKNSNIGSHLSGDVVTQNRYEIKNNRIYINDTGRYGKFENQTLNQEYIDDALVIKALNAMVDDYSYTEIMYIPDKYIINTLNICTGKRQDYINNGNYNFEVRFFENGNYNVKKNLNNEEFCEDAFMKIQLDKMWDVSSEYESDTKASAKNLGKLKKLCVSVFGKKVGEELTEYLEGKLIEASQMLNDEFEIKISEVKKIGKYTFNIFCSRDQKIMVFVKRP